MIRSSILAEYIKRVADGEIAAIGNWVNGPVRARPKFRRNFAIQIKYSEIRTEPDLNFRRKFRKSVYGVKCG